MRIAWNSAPLRIAAAVAAAAGAGWLAARKGRDWAARKAGGETRERGREREHRRRDKLVNDASEDSFPASDSLGYTQGTAGSPDRTG